MQPDEFEVAVLDMIPDTPEDIATTDASGLMRKLKSISDRIREVNDVYDAEKKRLDAWRDRELGKVAISDSIIRETLKKYIAFRREQIPDFMIRTPSGDAHLRTTPGGIVVEDPDKALECLRAIGRTDLIREKTTYAIDKKKLDAACIVVDDFVTDNTGTVIEGLAVKEPVEQLVLSLG